MPIPFVTIGVIAWSVFVCLAINGTKNMSDANAMRLGIYSLDQIYDGRWWALITSAFVHVQILHIYFNMYWLWKLGPILEREMGVLGFLGFILLTAFVSSGWDMVTGTSGIGFSGVGFAMVGFGWLAREKLPELKPYFTDDTVKWFAGWGVICIFLSYFKILNVGNMAHAMGAVAGGLIALAFVQKKWIARVCLVAVTALAIVPVYWTPWGSQWNFHRGIMAHKQKNYDGAIRYYRRSAELNPGELGAWINIAMIEGYRGHTAEYKDALDHVKMISPEEAKSLISDYGDGK